MSDIKIFKVRDGSMSELPGSALQVEKSLQKAFEDNLETLLGIRFLASEHSTGPVHGGRIDTLGLDEDGCPVIIEYKRAINENVINQGLYYLDWLLDHRKKFQWLVMERLGAEIAKDVDWSAPRLLCIAGDFTRYDEHAVKQIARNIELIRFRRFETDLLLLELIHAPKQAKATTASENSKISIETAQPAISTDEPDAYLSQKIAYRLSQSDSDLRDLFEATRQFLLGLGDDVRSKELKFYVAFKRLKNFACLEVYPQKRVVIAYLKVDPTTVELSDSFLRDVSQIGHFGTGNLEVSMRNMTDFENAPPLFRRSYEKS